MAIEPQVFLSTLEKRVNLTAEDKALLQSEIDWGKEIAPDMAEHFYDYLGRDEEMDGIVNATEGRSHRLKETFIQWFYEMFTGMDDWGSDYAERRWKIGLVHVRLGIGPQHVVPAMATVIREAGYRAKKDDKSENIKDALSRICMIDLAFIEQAYIEVTSEAVLRETGWTEGLFRRLIATGANSM
ncbi:MAG: protoglobin domain-containing protein [Cyanobacteria bacterium P01_D01_bin.50]